MIISSNFTLKEYKFKNICSIFLGYYIWSKQNLAPFVCIEPWFGVAAEENSNQNIEDKRGIQVLKKDEVFSCFYSIEV